MTDHVELKRLQTRKTEVERTISSLNKESADVLARLQREKAALAGVNREIQDLSKRNQKIVISEHSILRFLERVHRLDIEKLKQEILPPNIEAQARALGNGTYPVSSSHKLKVKDGTVVTILTDSEKVIVQ